MIESYKTGLKSLKLEQILEYKSQGFLFHGSSNDSIDTLEPKQALDSDSSNSFNNDSAIFATNNPASAIIFSLINRNLMPQDIREYDWEISWNEVGVSTAKIPIQWKDYLENTFGTLYVLKRDTFLERKGSQFKSKVPVKPLSKLKVSLEDYLSFGDSIIWI